MKSNYLKSIAPAPVEDEPKEEEVKEEAPAEKTEEELQAEKQKKIDDAMYRARHAAVSHITLNTESIFEIF